MKKIVLISHCVLNPFCELPQAPDELRKPILDLAVEKEWGIVQLPCPELSYQSLERASIYPGDEEAKPYEAYCKDLLKPLIKNIEEYKKHDIKIVGIIGIDTSPSCSVADKEAIMMKLLNRELDEMGLVDIPRADMPVNEEGDKETFLEDLQKWGV